MAGRAVIVNQQWYLAEDLDGTVMAVRKDARAVGHIKDGQIEVVRDAELEARLQAALN